MSKELTEQWRNRTLGGGWYFLEFENGSILPVYYCGFNREFEFSWDWKISEVLVQADYNQFSQMVKKVERLEQLLESETLAKNEGVELVAELEDRLKEAENVIRFYSNADGMSDEERQMTAEKYHLVYGLKAYDYLEKYGVEK